MTPEQNVAAIEFDIMEMFRVQLDAGVKLKRVMLAKGLTRARAKCPKCGNETLQGALAGRKNHMRMWCETPNCEMRMME